MFVHVTTFYSLPFSRLSPSLFSLPFLLDPSLCHLSWVYPSLPLSSSFIPPLFFHALIIHSLPPLSSSSFLSLPTSSLQISPSANNPLLSHPSPFSSATLLLSSFLCSFSCLSSLHFYLPFPFRLTSSLCFICLLFYLLYFFSLFYLSTFPPPSVPPYLYTISSCPSPYPTLPITQSSLYFPFPSPTFTVPLSFSHLSVLSSFFSPLFPSCHHSSPLSPPLPPSCLFHTSPPFSVTSPSSTLIRLSQLG